MMFADLKGVLRFNVQEFQYTDVISVFIASSQGERWAYHISHIFVKVL